MAATGSWMEHGPITTSNRSSLPVIMRRIALRVSRIRVSAGVPRMGKKRIRCSGGGSTAMSLMRSSSVWLVRSGEFCQDEGASVWALAFMTFSLRGREQDGAKKPPGSSRRRFLGGSAARRLRLLLSSAGDREPKGEIKRNGLGHHRQNIAP